MSGLGYYECKHCKTKFVREWAFKKHECEEKRRFDHSRTVKGKKAFAHYKYWLSLRGFKTAKRDTFITSRYYKSFVKFSEFCREKMIPLPRKYIDFMKSMDMLPQFWSRDDVYDSFLEVYDELYTPKDQVEGTLRTIVDIASKIDCQPGEIFEFLFPAEVMKYINSKKMSPWVLLLSNKFHVYVKSLSKHERIEITSMMDVDVWSDKFSENKDFVRKIKVILKELDL